MSTRSKVQLNILFHGKVPFLRHTPIIFIPVFIFENVFEFAANLCKFHSLIVLSSSFSSLFFIHSCHIDPTNLNVFVKIVVIRFFIVFIKLVSLFIQHAIPLLFPLLYVLIDGFGGVIDCDVGSPFEDLLSSFVLFSFSFLFPVLRHLLNSCFFVIINNSYYCLILWL